MPYEPMRGKMDEVFVVKEVDHPEHYNSHPSGIECIDIVRHENFNRGNAIKYIWRAGLKGKGLDSAIVDIEKAIWYLQDELNRIKTMKGQVE